MTVYGVDVSRWQGMIDFAKVKGDGISFAFLKATQGTSYGYADWYTSTLDNARHAQFPVLGSYLFMMDEPGAAQADYYVARVDAGGARGYAHELDTETAPGPQYPTAAETAAAARRIKALIPGAQVGCYTGYWYWSGILGGPPMPASVDYLWESRYVYNGALRPWRDCADEVPATWWDSTRCGGRTPAILQINSNALVAGISGGVDLDVFPGTLTELRAMLGQGGVDVALTDPEINSIDDRVWRHNLDVPPANRPTWRALRNADVGHDETQKILAAMTAKLTALQAATAAQADDQTVLTRQIDTLAAEWRGTLSEVRAAQATAAAVALTSLQQVLAALTAGVDTVALQHLIEAALARLTAYTTLAVDSAPATAEPPD